MLINEVCVLKQKNEKLRLFLRRMLKTCPRAEWINPKMEVILVGGAPIRKILRETK